MSYGQKAILCLPTISSEEDLHCLVTLATFIIRRIERSSTWICCVPPTLLPPLHHFLTSLNSISHGVRCSSGLDVWPKIKGSCVQVPVISDHFISTCSPVQLDWFIFPVLRFIFWPKSESLDFRGAQRQWYTLNTHWVKLEDDNLKNETLFCYDVIREVVELEKNLIIFEEQADSHLCCLVTLSVHNDPWQLVERITKTWVHKVQEDVISSTCCRSFELEH
jgi:hypothetical protein